MTATYVRTRNIPLDELTPYPGNAKRGDVEAIRASLRRNGQYRSLVVREIEHGPLIVLAGNHTMQALIAEGAATARCEVIRCDDAEARRINLADNRTSELGTYDEDALAALLSALDGDLDGTGYTDADVDHAVAQYAGDDLSSAPPAGDAYTAADTPPVPDAPAEPVTRRGDVWLLGPHRIMCGDCRDGADVDRLLDGAAVNLAFTSPPYASQRDYDAESGFKPIPPDGYVEWFAPVAAAVRRVLADDGSWFVNIKASADGLDTYLYVHDLVIAHAREWGWHYATELCWRRIGVPKSVAMRFKNQFEPVYQFTKGRWKMRPESVRHESDSVPVAGGPGSGKTSWRDKQGGNGSMFGGDGALPGIAYPGNMLPTFSGDHTATGHTAAFPVGLPQFFIRAYTDAGDTVYDPFMGSGSTLLAADREGRVAYGMEISPKYVDVICKRYQKVTGTKPVLERTGAAHDFTDRETEDP